MAKRSCLGLVCRVLWARFGMLDEDPDSQPHAAEPATSQKLPERKQVCTRKNRVSAVLDPTDEGEAEHILQYVLRSHFVTLVEWRGGPVREAAEPTADKGVTIRARVLQLEDGLYGDFSILAPYGRRLQNRLKTNSCVFLPDGTRGLVDMPGPPSFEDWSGCWWVYDILLLGLPWDAEVP